MLRANEWLVTAVVQLRTAGLIRPDCPDFDVSLGYGLAGRRAMGECFPPNWSDGRCIVFASPRSMPPMTRLGVLIHESIHVGLFHEGGRGLKINGGHGRRFITRAEEVGLEVLSKNGYTEPGPKLMSQLSEVALRLPGYEHFPNLEVPPRKAASAAAPDPRLLSCFVCGYAARVSVKQQRFGVPACPNKKCPYKGVVLGENPMNAVAKDNGVGTIVTIPSLAGVRNGIVVVR